MLVITVIIFASILAAGNRRINKLDLPLCSSLRYATLNF